MRFTRGRWPTSGGSLSQDVASTKSSRQSLLESHEKNGPVLMQNVAFTALGTEASGWLIGGTRKERRCFAAECGPDSFGHTRALEGPFSDLRIRAPWCRGLGSSSPASMSGSGNQGRSLRRQILFTKCAFYSGPVADLGGDPFPRCGLHLIESGQSLLESHEKNGPVLLQNVALTALDTKASGWFIGGTRKERRCFAAECSLDHFRGSIF